MEDKKIFDIIFSWMLLGFELQPREMLVFSCCCLEYLWVFELQKMKPFFVLTSYVKLYKHLIFYDYGIFQFLFDKISGISYNK